MAFLIRGQFELIIPEPHEPMPEDAIGSAVTHADAMELVHMAMGFIGARVLYRDELTPAQQAADSEALRLRAEGGLTLMHDEVI